MIVTCSIGHPMGKWDCFLSTISNMFKNLCEQCFNAFFFMFLETVIDGLMSRTFLGATEHLYMRVCPSVCPSVCQSVHRSIRRSVCRSVRRSVSPSLSRVPDVLYSNGLVSSNLFPLYLSFSSLFLDFSFLLFILSLSFLHYSSLLCFLSISIFPLHFLFHSLFFFNLYPRSTNFYFLFPPSGHFSPLFRCVLASL